MAFGYDGSIRIDTKINSKGFNTGINAMTGSLKKLAGAIGIAFGVAAVVNFGKESVKAASELSSALIGLQSIVEGQGRSFARAQSFIQDYIKDGLIPMQSAATAYKNLAQRGYSTDQIEKTLVALKDASAFGRQASLSMGEAVSSATEGLKNENSILVDNAGVTKNVSVMWKEYADQLGVGVQSLSKSQKIQAEVNGVMQETRYQIGDAAKVTTTYAGQMAMLAFNFQQLKVAVGNAIMPIAKAVLPSINAIILALTVLANVFAQVTSLLFGGGGMKAQADTQKELATSGSQAAGATEDLSKATDGIGKSSKKASKEVKNSLASFDELNVLAKETAGSLGDASGSMEDISSPDIGSVDVGQMWQDVEVNPEVVAFVENLRNAMARLNEALGPTKTALARLWEQLKIVGGFAWDGLKTFYQNFLVPVGAWVLGEGLPRFIGLLSETLQNIDWGKINTSLGALWAELSKIATFVGNSLIDFYEYFLKPIAEWTMNEAIPSLVDALTKGLGSVNWDTIRNALIDLWKALEPFAINVGEGLLWFATEVLIPLGVWTINEAIPLFIEGIAAALDIFNSVWEVVKPGLLWLLENFLKPIAAWTGGAIISILDSLVGLLKLIADHIEPIIGALVGVGSAIGAIKFAEFMINIGGIPGLFDAIHNSASILVTSLFSLAGAFATKTAAMIKDKLETLQLIGLYAKDLIASITTTITNLAKEAAAWVTSTAAKAANAVQQGLATAATLAWNAAAGIATTVTTAFGAAVNFLTSPIGLVITAIGALVAIVVLLVKHWDEIKEAAGKAWDWIVEKWGGAAEWFDTNIVKPVAEFFTSLWGGIKEKASETWDGIKEIWNIVSSWFQDNIITPISTAFSGLWNGIKEAAQTVWDRITEVFENAETWFDTNIISPISNAFKSFFNGLIGFAEGFVNFFIRGINKIIDSINGLSFDLPEFLGGGHVGFDIPKASELKLPRLANGAVIPPNRQFAAIVGDQRSGTNIEAPLSTIEQAVLNALSQKGMGGGGEITITMPVYLDSKEIYRGQKTIQREMGRNLVEGLA